MNVLREIKRGESKKGGQKGESKRMQFWPYFNELADEMCEFLTKLKHNE